MKGLTCLEFNELYNGLFWGGGDYFRTYWSSVRMGNPSGSELCPATARARSNAARSSKECLWQSAAWKTKIISWADVAFLCFTTCDLWCFAALYLKFLKTTWKSDHTSLIMIHNQLVKSLNSLGTKLIVRKQNFTFTPWLCSNKAHKGP